MLQLNRLNKLLIIHECNHKSVSNFQVRIKNSQDERPLFKVVRINLR